MSQIPTKRMKSHDDTQAESTTSAGIDVQNLDRLPRSTLINIIIKSLSSSDTLRAAVNDALQSIGPQEDGQDPRESDSDATDLESLSGDEAASFQADATDEKGQFAGMNLSVLAKLIMEIMNSAPAPEGGMPWREFEGIWPPVMGSVEEAIAECKRAGLLVAVNGNEQFVVSTMPIQEHELS